MEASVSSSTSRNFSITREMCLSYYSAATERSIIIDAGLSLLQLHLGMLTGGTRFHIRQHLVKAVDVASDS